MRYVVTGKRILVVVEKAETKTASGLIMPDNNKLPTYATIFSIGAEAEGPYTIGDRVLLSSRYAGTIVPPSDESNGDWRVITENDIVVIVFE